MRTLLTPVGAPNARRPHRPKARTDGAAKQRKPAANHHNASRPAPTTAGLLDRRPDRTRYPAIAFTSPTERAGEPVLGPAAASWWRWSLVRLWVAISNRHSVRTAVLPLR